MARAFRRLRVAACFGGPCATHQGVDALVGEVVVGGSVVLHHLAILGVVSLADLVDLLVDLRAMVVAFLTGAGHREGHTGRVPGPDAGHLAQTTMSFARQLLCVPTAGDTYNSRKHLPLTKMGPR